jgi:predicted NAD-dependent protein-ADP-ribosyltransferase YbiA (DUF1768 family)
MSTPTIKGFTGNHRFLALNYPLDKTIIEKVGPVKFRYPTLRKAYHAHRTDDLTLKEMIIQHNSNLDPATVVPIEKERDDWYKLRERVMYRLLKLKFGNVGLRTRLLETGDAMLINLDNRDLFWGQDVNGKGENRLGVLIMRLRDEYRLAYSKTAA